MKKTNKKNKNILINQQFKLGSIINPIIEPIIIEPFNIETIKIEPINIKNNIESNINSNILNYSENENINDSNLNSIESFDPNNTNNYQECNLNPIDIVFGSIINKPPSPLPIIEETIDKNSNSNNNDDFLKQIYPPLNLNDKLNKNLENQIFTNIEIKSKIDKLSENELYEIFKIIKNNKEKYSTNKNGIFINISTLKKITITEICKFIVFCENNNIIFNNEEKTRDIYREMLL